MSTDFTALGKPFQLNKFPDIQCPACKKGYLRHRENSIKLTESMASREFQGHEEWSPFDIEGTFIGYLRCNYHSCKEFVAVIGEYSIDADYDDDGDQIWPEFLTLRHMIPAPLLFKIPTNAPERIARYVESASSLLWSSPEASANALRSCIEVVLDEHNIASKTQGGKFIPLQQRLQQFEAIHADAAKLFEAVKWIGNQGSHIGDVTLTPDHILEDAGYLRTGLELLYPEPDVTTVMLTNAGTVIANKGVK